MKLLRLNCAEYPPDSPHELYHCQLDWENDTPDKVEIKSCRKRTSEEALDAKVKETDKDVMDTTSVTLEEFGQIDVVIGADIVYWYQSIDPMLGIVD